MNNILYEKLKELFSKGEHRPVNVAILHRGKAGSLEFLIVRSAKSPVSWLFPQGGINVGEDIKASLYRELEEELSIKSNEIADIGFGIYFDILDTEPTRRDKRDFSRGKAYIFNIARYIGDSNFKLKSDEIDKADWMNYNKAVRHFNIGRPTKAKLLENALNAGLYHLLSKEYNVEEI